MALHKAPKHCSGIEVNTGHTNESDATSGTCMNTQSGRSAHKEQQALKPHNDDAVHNFFTKFQKNFIVHWMTQHVNDNGP